MADVEHGNVQLCVQAFQIRQHLGLALHIERGQRFVHQKQSWAGGQCAGNRYTLALTARQRVGLALQKFFDTEQLYRLAE